MNTFFFFFPRYGYRYIFDKKIPAESSTRSRSKELPTVSLINLEGVHDVIQDMIPDPFSPCAPTEAAGCYTFIPLPDRAGKRCQCPVIT